MARLSNNKVAVGEVREKLRREPETAPAR